MHICTFSPYQRQTYLQDVLSTMNKKYKNGVTQQISYTVYQGATIKIFIEKEKSRSCDRCNIELINTFSIFEEFRSLLALKFAKSVYVTGPYELQEHGWFYVQELPWELPGPIVLGQSEGTRDGTYKILRTGAFLYYRYSFLLISNKFCNGGSTAVK